MNIFRKFISRTKPEVISVTTGPAQPVKKTMVYALANLQGLGKRDNQEDSFAFGNALDPGEILRKGLLAVIADGMGGLAGGKIASETAAAAVLGAFREFDMAGDLARQLRDAVAVADKKVAERLNGMGGTTVVAGLLYGGKLWFTSVGDSDLFLLRGRSLIRMNTVHTVYSMDILEGLRSGRLDLETARRNPERNAVTSYLGMNGLADADSLRIPWKLAAGDVLLFCTDGVSRTLDPDRIRSCLSTGGPEEMCAALEREIKKENRESQDNYTALIVQCLEREE